MFTFPTPVAEHFFMHECGSNPAAFSLEMCGKAHLPAHLLSVGHATDKEDRLSFVGGWPCELRSWRRRWLRRCVVSWAPTSFVYNAQTSMYSRSVIFPLSLVSWCDSSAVRAVQQVSTNVRACCNAKRVVMTMIMGMSLRESNPKAMTDHAHAGAQPT